MDIICGNVVCAFINIDIICGNVVRVCLSTWILFVEMLCVRLSMYLHLCLSIFSNKMSFVERRQEKVLYYLILSCIKFCQI